MSARPLRSWLAPAAAALLLIGAAGGCSGATESFDPILLDRQAAMALVKRAQTHAQADERRLAVNRVARSRYLADGEVLKALGTIARSDPNTPVRVAAATALGTADTPEACAYCAALLPGAAVPIESFPSEDVRSELLAGLERCAASKRLTARQSEHAAEVGVRVLKNDLSRQARLAAARMLGYCPRRDVLDALIGALEQRDFGVCNAAEVSLKRLTGRSFNHDPAAWRQFVASGGDPFAGAAQPAPDSGGIDLFGWLSAD